MPLKCISNGQDMFSFDFEEPEDWEGLRTRNRKEHVLKMSCCGSEVVLKTSKLGTQYFTHAKKGTCSSVPETAEVMLAKEVVAKASRRAGWTVHVEASGQMHEGENWTVDVLVSRNSGAQVAFAIHWGHVSFEEMSRRQALHRSAGIRTMWLMRQHDVPVDKAVPAFRLSRDDSTGTCFVSLPGPYFHPAFASAKNGNDPNHWRQRIELGRFVEGALAGKLHFAPQVGRTLPMDVCAAYTECWRCKKTTGLVIDLCFAASRVLQGAADVTAKIYDFDDEGRGAALLMSTLSVAVLARHDIGPIKPRYSRTEGQPYLSNGCIHCDALQGRFFDHEVAYDAHPVFSIDVLFDDRWVSHLEDREAIDKWWFDDQPGESAAHDAPQG